MSLASSYNYQIHYCDSDAGGVVYHSRYLEIFERARFSFLFDQGLDIRQLADQGFIFAVVNADISYRQAAKLWQTLRIESRIVSLRRCAVVFEQLAYLDGSKALLCSARIELVCIRDMKACRIPEVATKIIRPLVHTI